MDISVRRTSPLIVEDRSWLGDADGTKSNRSITLAMSLFTQATHFPDGVLRSGTLLARVTAPGATYGLYGPYAGRTSEVQTVTITGGPTGGTFTLTLNGETTAAIAYNATAAAVQSALVALPSIGGGDVAVTGSAGGPYTVLFGGDLAGENVPAMTASGAGLTGGTTPGVTVATTTGGGSAVTSGLDTPAGFLYNTIEIVQNGMVNLANRGAPMLERGFIRPQLLPPNSGLDDAARQLLSNHFIFRD